MGARQRAGYSLQFIENNTYKIISILSKVEKI